MLSIIRSKFTSVINSARGTNSHKNSFNVVEGTSTENEEKPIVKSRTFSSSNPFKKDEKNTDGHDAAH